MAAYDTKQKRALLDFLNANPDRGFSVEELYTALLTTHPDDPAPGKSTLYRLIARLVSEGLVKRFSVGNGRQFAYQIVSCHTCDTHLHLKCTACGCLYHMDHAVSERIMTEVLRRSDFSLDERETVLFGVCHDCRQRDDK